MGLTRVVAETIGVASTVVLARLIAPAEFGYTAAALFLSAIAIAVAQQGFGSFLVHLDDPSTEHFRGASLASIVTGAAFTALTLMLSLTLAPLIFGSRAADLAALASPVFLLAGLSAVPIAQLQRRLDFRRLGAIEVIASLLRPVVAIVLAAAFGLDAEAIVAGLLVGSAMTAVAGWALSRPPAPRWHAGEVRQIFRYGLPASGSSILHAANRNIDYLLLAAFIPARQVGLYMRAFALGSDYQAKISRVLLDVSFPVLSRAQDRDEVRRIRARMIRVHAAVLFPLLFGLIAVAPEFVPWLYGEPWAEAGELTQILAVAGMIAALGTGTGPLLMATGHPGALLRYNVISFIAYTAAVLAAAPFGVTAVCVAVVAVRLVTFVILQRVIVEREVGIPILETVRDDAIPAVVGGVPLMLVTMLGLELGMEAGLHPVVSMLVPGLLGLALYAAILRVLFPDTWTDLSRLSGRLGRPRSALSAVRRRAGMRSGGRAEPTPVDERGS
jgi:PST family polysaccharide transporter